MSRNRCLVCGEENYCQFGIGDRVQRKRQPDSPVFVVVSLRPASGSGKDLVLRAEDDPNGFCDYVLWEMDAQHVGGWP